MRVFMHIEIRNRQGHAHTPSLRHTEARPPCQAAATRRLQQSPLFLEGCTCCRPRHTFWIPSICMHACIGISMHLCVSVAGLVWAFRFVHVRMYGRENGWRDLNDVKLDHNVGEDQIMRKYGACHEQCWEDSFGLMSCM